MREWRLFPIDTLFFRGSVPYTMDHSPQDDVYSEFPPPPSTVSGALRAALARTKGWSGIGRWPDCLDAVLGNGFEQPGSLRVVGPFVSLGGRLLYCIPRHLAGIGNPGWRPVAFFAPGERIHCDEGELALPILDRIIDPEDRPEPGEGIFVTVAGMNRILRAELPEESELIRASQLWESEKRIGLELERETRTAKNGSLYSCHHVRLTPSTFISVFVEGLPEGWELPARQFVPLGGEGRMAWAEVGGVLPRLEVPRDEIIRQRGAVLIALSPVFLERSVLTGKARLELPGNPRVVSGCVARPVRIGGWDSLRRVATPVRSYLPAGSVLFLEIEEPGELLRAVDDWGLIRIGPGSCWGFGVATLARLPAGGRES